MKKDKTTNVGICVIAENLGCPKCGWKCYKGGGLVVDFVNLKGEYCTRCWGEQISKTIPKMTPLPTKSKKTVK